MSKRYRVTVDGTSYDVTVEDLGGASAPVSVAAPAPSAAPAAPRPSGPGSGTSPRGSGAGSVGRGRHRHRGPHAGQDPSGQRKRWNGGERRRRSPHPRSHEDGE
ncbi:hypothetical protein Amico_0884 [Aminobacterium colombiense DSM 12261]|uniref:Uncharacterized protein n=1 Tax=Aminobacterium colombiense (strain DSM 12261 / ALA-1) TaxID=572547 RepID=D5EEN3_AMICL|nr:hypothetical protein [Aminobacterium colombiense]ADE57015.1 hypothetical protein Amico_0884 [Aminobacterium colombiense DSM 12261]